MICRLSIPSVIKNKGETETDIALLAYSFKVELETETKANVIGAYFQVHWLKN